jgi:hypothetical protein
MPRVSLHTVAPDFRLPDLYGDPVSLSDFRGRKNVLLAFAFLLLTRVSGIPLLEAKADAKWGRQEAYEAYKKRTSVLVPLPPRR